jgi:hypothetical protein
MLAAMHLRRELAVLFLSIGLLGACGGGSGTTADAGPECNLLGEVGCALPLPSSVYLREDSTSNTGFRVDYAPGVLPTNNAGVTVDVAWYNRRDGFSADVPILAAFPTGVSTDALPPITDPGVSLTSASGTLLVDMETNQPVPHFAEVDVQADMVPPMTPDRQALIIRPVVRLKPAHRYAVGIRKLVKAKDGSPLPVPPGYQAFLDGRDTGDARFERFRARFPEILASLSAAGALAAPTDLVVAWDFVTASDETATSDLLNARDTALAVMGDMGANMTFTVESDVPFGDPLETARRVSGTYTVPQLLTAGGGNNGVLNRGSDGKPAVVTGEWYEAPFTAVIPTCALTQHPVGVVIYGHGLMGSLDEAAGGYPRRAAQRMCLIFMATNWRGMSTEDIDNVALALSDANNMDKVGEKLVQGLVNFMGLVQIIRGPMSASAVFTEGGAPLIDPSKIYYYGISQGGIYGATFMAYDPYVTRGVLGVPGANYSLMVERSTDWPIYYNILYGSYADPLLAEIVLWLLQHHFDATDPITTYPGILGTNAASIPGTPPKQILLQMAVGDSQVPNIATLTAARTSGLPILGPTVTPVEGLYDLTVQDGPLSSALTLWNEHKVPVPPLTNSSSSEDNGTHGSLRKRDKANDQIDHFFKMGEIIQTCGTDPAAPVACDCVDEVTCGPTP